MNHDRVNALFLAVSIALLTSGCAFGPGEPFGELGAVLGGSIDNRGRIDSDGWLRTVGSFEVRLDRLELHVEYVRLIESKSPSGGSAGFDPSNVPPGWLCHAGHCHTPEGDLVSYDEAARLLAGTGPAESDLATFVVGASLDMLDDDDLLLLADCLPDCLVGRSTAGTLAVDVSRLELEGEVRDISPNNRLPVATMPLKVAIDTAGVAIISNLQDPLSFDRGLPPIVSLDLWVLVHPSLFDGISFDELAAAAVDTIEIFPGSGSLPEAELILANFLSSRLQVDVSREHF